jgi:hypothetical protein
MASTSAGRKASGFSTYIGNSRAAAASISGRRMSVAVAITTASVPSIAAAAPASPASRHDSSRGSAPKRPQIVVVPSTDGAGADDENAHETPLRVKP